MSEELLKIKGYTINDMNEYIRNADLIEEEICKYKGTNLKQSNLLFNKILDEEEMDMLHYLLLSKNGWYKKINGEGAIKLKLTAAAIGFGHSKIHRNNIPIEIIENIQKKISKEEEALIINCYLKQKIVTKKTLINYQKYVNTKNKINIYDNQIRLYRGAKGDFDIYRTINLESWSTQLNIAKRFAKTSGIILKSDVDIDNIFCCRKTTFRHPHRMGIYQSRPIRSEHEYIVENIDEDKVPSEFK